jgi:serine/threonine protein kinase
LTFYKNILKKLPDRARIFQERRENPTMTAEKIPEKFGRYEVIGELGRGSMGMVYKARDPVIGRLVAIKAIPETFGLDPDKRKEYIKRLEREAITAGRLQHPNIVTIYDVGESEYGPYIAMEFLDGITLREIISSGKKLTLVQVAEFIRQAADGLDYAHSRAVIHRDIKPANLMLVENIVKIMDLGIARLPVSDLTREGKLVGSPSYMSPEQVQGKQLDGRSDLFSLGIVIYQATTGYKPFSGKDVHEICYKIVTEDFPAGSL